MDEYLLERCEKFANDFMLLRREYAFSGYDSIAAVINIFHNNEQDINLAALDEGVKYIRNELNIYRPDYIPLIRVFSAMMYVSEYDPDVFITHVKSFRGKFSRSFEDTLGLVTLAVSAATFQPVEYQSIYYKALSIYNQMKDLHRSLTHDKDVIYAGILALFKPTKDDVVDELVIMDDLLSNEYKLKTDYARRLAYVLALCDGTAVHKVERAMKFILQISGKWDRNVDYLYYLLPAVIANLNIPVEQVFHDYLEVDYFLRQQDLYEFFEDDPISLHACMLLADYYVGNHLAITALINAMVLAITKDR